MVTEDGRELGKEYDDIFGITNINNHLVFRAKKDGRWFVVTEDGQELGKEYDNIEDIININNKLVFSAQKNDEYFVVAYDIKKQDELLPSELQKLGLLNLVHHPDLSALNRYLQQTSPLKQEHSRTLWQKTTDFFSRSQPGALGFSKISKQMPEILFDTLSAKKDRAINILCDRILYKTFPEIFKDDPIFHNFASYFGLGQGGNELRSSRKNPSDFLNPDNNGFEGGDPIGTTEGRDKKIMELREKIGGFVATRILGKGLDNPSNATPAFFPINHHLEGPFKETTITLPELGNLKKIRLPKPINSLVIPGRVKGIDRQGQEIPLEIDTNSLGETDAIIKNGVNKLAYSLQVSENPLDHIIPDIDAERYSRYCERFLKENGADLTQEIVHLPEELELFAASLATKPPKQRIIEIQSFVRHYGYYDFANKEMIPLKRGKNAEELLAIMSARIEELKEKNPSLSDKRYAGVCSDFALLQTALLRKAGILAGVATGFAAESLKVTSDMAHGVSFVVLPDKDRRNQVFSVDGTPNGTSERENQTLADLSGPSIEQDEKKAKERIEELTKEAEADLDKIERAILEQDLEEIKKLTNGNLENALNTILKYEVKDNNLTAINRLLSGYWYSPLSHLDLDSSESSRYAQETLIDELRRLHNGLPQETGSTAQSAGSQLFDSVRNFVRRFEKENRGHGLDLIEQIGDMAQSELSAIEKRSLAVIVNYLRAKKMAK